jgi:hypothetical protein
MMKQSEEFWSVIGRSIQSVLKSAMAALHESPGFHVDKNSTTCF